MKDRSDMYSAYFMNQKRSVIDYVKRFVPEGYCTTL
jgi:hypothetical protein